MNYLSIHLLLLLVFCFISLVFPCINVFIVSEQEQYLKQFFILKAWKVSAVQFYPEDSIILLLHLFLLLGLEWTSNELLASALTEQGVKNQNRAALPRKAFLNRNKTAEHWTRQNKPRTCEPKLGKETPKNWAQIIETNFGSKTSPKAAI